MLNPADSDHQENLLLLIEKLQVFKIQGRDKQGRRILRIIGKFFPARIVSVDAVKRYLESRLMPELESGPFAILYIHSGTERCENFPGLSGLRSIYDAVPKSVRRNLEAVYFLHPDLQARIFVATFGRLIFTGGLYGKLKYVSRLDYLWGEHVRRRSEGGGVELPEFVHDYDEELEHRTMVMDYGLESDHPRVYDDGPLVGMYSMRCIS